MPTTQHTVAIHQVQWVLMGARHQGLDVQPLLAEAVSLTGRDPFA